MHQHTVHLTNYIQIERWWKMVMSAYLLVSLHTSALRQPQGQSAIQCNTQPEAMALKLAQHSGWNQSKGWKSALNNLRSVIEPSIILNVLEPWLNLFPIPRLTAVLECLVALMNRFPGSLPCHTSPGNLQFSSA